MATLDDTPDEADVDENELDHPISDWEGTSRAAAASDNNNGERATNPEDGERETSLYGGEEEIGAPKARITAADTRTSPSASTRTTARVTGTQKLARDSGPKSLRATGPARPAQRRNHRGSRGTMPREGERAPQGGCRR
ncbi:hypothetical protein PsorP6_010543 [Peronosclerospora sorghi]|uniref:Uncharacterized protein n=1 Tax=Peronosclerospora sorghi TaxID=230839 RepID=A0ACC0VX38_9STRA|nr:hypothetical protein PsorP6_010543 [Peronosclerospora sorghi]